MSYCSCTRTVVQLYAYASHIQYWNCTLARARARTNLVLRRQESLRTNLVQQQQESLRAALPAALLHALYMYCTAVPQLLLAAPGNAAQRPARWPGRAAGIALGCRDGVPLDKSCFVFPSYRDYVLYCRVGGMVSQF